jgi:hypothetical protein
LLPVAPTLRSGKLDRLVKYRFFRRSNFLAKRVSGDRLAIIHRSALRIFDACETGDMNTAEAMFRELEKN